MKRLEHLERKGYKVVAVNNGVIVTNQDPSLNGAYPGLCKKYSSVTAAHTGVFGY